MAGVENVWTPSEHDIKLSREAYFRYLTGVAILNNPQEERLLPIHQRDPVDPEQREEIIVSARNLIWEGFINVVRFSNPMGRRSDLTEAEPYFYEASPNMIKMASLTALYQKERLMKLNPRFLTLLPLPVAYDEAIYKHVCHGRTDKLKIGSAMAEFSVHPILGKNVGDRNFFIGRSRQRSSSTANR